MEIQDYDDAILALIVRYLAGMASRDEVIQLKEWIGGSSGNKQFFEQIRNIWDATDKQIDLKKINTKEALENISARIAETNTKRSFWFYWQKVAAVLILPLLIGILVFNSKKSISSNDIVYNEVFAAFGTRLSLRLSDSSLVWLNSGSSLRYPNKFDTKNRVVYLKGEGYFDIKSDIHQPFTVKTSSMEVKASGTKFNVLEYDMNPVAEVTLVSGKITVSGSADSINRPIISELIPDQHLVYNRQTKDFQITEENAYRFTAWKDGKLVFRNEPLERVLNKLSMIYNVDIELQGKELKDYRYHATFEEESLEEILKLLKLSAPINFKEVKREPLPDGSFPKKKVIIYPVGRRNKI